MISAAAGTCWYCKTKPRWKEVGRREHRQGWLRCRPPRRPCGNPGGHASPRPWLSSAPSSPSPSQASSASSPSPPCRGTWARVFSLAQQQGDRIRKAAGIPRANALRRKAADEDLCNWRRSAAARGEREKENGKEVRVQD
jgi:hypothetical protein